MTEAEQISAFANVPLSLANLVVGLAEERGVPVTVLRSPCRLRPLVHVRWEIARRARQLDYSLWQIGRALNRDHSTVIHALQQPVETGENVTSALRNSPGNAIEQNMKTQEELLAA